MRKLRIFEHISLDGVIEVSGGAGDDDFPYGDWTAPYRTPEGFAMVTAMYGETFDLLLGRRTRSILSCWAKGSAFLRRELRHGHLRWKERKLCRRVSSSIRSGPLDL